jgi:hypothetical protein
MRTRPSLLRRPVALFAFAASLCTGAPAEAAEPRMTRAEFLFRAAQPCPATGRTHSICKGYVVDRVIPLVCGGEDAPANMRWLTVAEAQAKAKWDRIGCRPGRTYVFPSLAAPSATQSYAADLPPAAMEVRSLSP